MRILFVSHSWYPEGRGGTEIHARDVALGLVRRGHQVGVFARTGDPALDEYAMKIGVDGGATTTFIKNSWREFHDFEWLYRNDRIHEAFRKELKQFRPDLVHIHHLSGLSTTLIEELKREHIPTVMTLHDFWMACPRGQRMRPSLDLCEDVDRELCFRCLGALWPHLFVQRDAVRTIVDLRGRLSPAPLAEFDRHMVYAMNLCDRLITPSEFHRERMLDFPIDPERIIALPHGLDHQRIPESKARESRPARKIGFIGSVIPVKGVHVLLQAFKALARPEIELHIHGEAPGFHEIKNYGAELRAAADGVPGVHFHGAYAPDDLAEILAGLDVVVVPSLWWETFCLTIREALLSGAPVIASDIGAMREALDGEEGGLFFAAGDAQDLTRQLARFLDDPALRASLHGHRAKVRAFEPYLARLEQIYLETLAISARRAKDLVVAPPAFPVRPAPPVTPPPAAVTPAAEQPARTTKAAPKLPAETPATDAIAPTASTKVPAQRVGALPSEARSEVPVQPPRESTAAAPAARRPQAAQPQSAAATATEQPIVQSPQVTSQGAAPAAVRAPESPGLSALPVPPRERRALPRERLHPAPVLEPAEVRRERPKLLSAYRRDEDSETPVVLQSMERHPRTRKEPCPRGQGRQREPIRPIEIPLHRRAPDRPRGTQTLDLRRRDHDDSA